MTPRGNENTDRTRIEAMEDAARSIETFIWETCRSPEDLVHCFVMRDTSRRVTAEDVASSAPNPDLLGADDLRYNNEILTVDRRGTIPGYLLQGVRLEDVEAYEDSVTATSRLLSALCYQYRATRAAAILERCEETFRALVTVYELGLEEEPGWIPKPYGGRCSSQSSMDNQCPFAVSLLDYFPSAPEASRAKIVEILEAQAMYWIRHRYRMHRPYFGLTVDYARDRIYPGHWPLFFLPQLNGLWRITRNRRYLDEFHRLAGLVYGTDREPSYLKDVIRCSHRWYYQYAALLDSEAPYPERWRDGLAAQIAAVGGEATADMRYRAIRHLDLSVDKHLSDVIGTLEHADIDEFLYRWPMGYTRIIAPLAWRTRAVYTVFAAERLELFRRGRMNGAW